jgi:hypothetical protein
VRKLARLHAELEPLRRGSLVNLHVAPQQYAYARVTKSASVIIVINNDSKPATMEFDVTRAGIPKNAPLIVYLGTARRGEVKDGMLRVTIPARSASILSER